MIKLYTGISTNNWNGALPDVGNYACVSPVYGNTRTRSTSPFLLPHVRVLQDSGAFQDDINRRCSFSEALDRQIEHAEKHGYFVEARVSYDLLIDEVWQNGKRTKNRWTVKDANYAVAETIAAAKYLSENRYNIPHLVLSAQGVDAEQYLNCVTRVIQHMDVRKDWLGMGGWCIIGKMPKQMMPVFRDTIKLVIPYAAKKGVKRIHIFGVIYPTALGELLWMCDRHDIELSTDSAGVHIKPNFGEWGYGEWRDNSYNRQHHLLRSIDRKIHVKNTTNWLATFRCTKWYREPKFVPNKAHNGYIQFSMF